MKHEEFYDLTPAEFEEVFKGYQDRRKRDLEDLVYQAWHVAKLSRLKDIPNLEDLFNRKPEKKPQTDEEMLAKARILNALFGGKEVTA